MLLRHLAYRIHELNVPLTHEEAYVCLGKALLNTCYREGRTGFFENPFRGTKKPTITSPYEMLVMKAPRYSRTRDDVKHDYTTSV